MRILALAASFLLASLAAAAQTLTPAGDAHVRGGAAANNNYGGVVLLGVRTANNALNTYWSYIKFDTSGVSGQVTSAKLRLLTALSSSGSVQTNLYATAAAWGETTITWNNKPALGVQLGSFTVANTAYVWFEVDVTAYVQAQQGQGAVAFALANPGVSSQLVAVQSRESSNPAQLVLVMNSAPSVTLTSPANGATFTAPATVPLAATAADADGTIAKVEFFHGGTNLIATVTTAPYTFDWTNVTAASYTLTAKATDNLNATTTSAPVNVTVNTGVAQLFFIYTDHLNTPRVITNQASEVAWRWDHAEPFGSYPANSNPSGLGTFEFNLRLPGQYFDKETNLHYNYFRDYDPATGRYPQSDPIGLLGGINTYVYTNNPLSEIDPYGLMGFGGGGSANPGKPMPPQGPGPTSQVIGAAGDFWRNYMNMRAANTIGADLYFHCMANCQAARRGPSGYAAACGISDTREWIDQNIFGDPASASQADQAANLYGRGWGANTSLPCEITCLPYRPNALPPQY